MTLTKEWLLKTISELEEERDATPGAVNEDAAMALAAMKLALASLEAEPVAMRWRYLPDGIHGMGEWNYRNQAYIDPLNAYHLSRQKELLFTAPPAPVSLPEEVASAIESLKQNLVDCNRYNYCFDAVKRVEDACSAAMLQGAEPVKTGLTLREGIAVIRNSGIAIDAEKIQEERDALNSPAIPDGWVACSERMPETAGNYWGWWSESKRQGSVWFIKSELQAQFQSSEITHWMPLPAAPQQEDIIC